MLKRIFVCSEFGGLEANVALAYEFCRYVVGLGHNVFAPHGFYPYFLNEHDSGDREIGIRCGIDWMSCCDEVWVFVRHGKLAKGMRQEVQQAIADHMVVKYFDASLFDMSKKDQTAITALPHIAGDTMPTEAELLSARDFAIKARKGLANVAKALTKGVKYEDLQEAVDQLLGESEQPRDEALEERWEQDYRANR